MRLEIPEGVVVQQVETRFPIESAIKKLAKPPILFDREDFRAGIQQFFRERSKSRPDLQHPVSRRQIAHACNAEQLILVVQKILPERFGQLNASRGEQLAHLREFHNLRSSSP